MDRSSILRWVVIFAAIVLIWKVVLPKFTGSSDKGQVLPQEVYVNAPGFAPDIVDPGASLEKPDDGEICTIKSDRFEATFASRGAGLMHLRLQGAQYMGPDGPFDLSTTPDIERWRSLRTLFRGPNADDQVQYDRFPWKLEPRSANEADQQSCTFSYDDGTVRIVKAITPSVRPFELDVTTTVTNLATTPKKHRFSIGAYAFRRNHEIKGSLGRVSPFQTELSCAAGSEVVRKSKDDFKAGSITVAGADRYAAVTSHYFAQAIMPEPGDGAIAETPTCEILAEEWLAAGQAHDADDAAAVYHAKLVYPTQELASQASVTYRQSAFFGPKERDVLANAGGGHSKLGDLINLGFFSPVAKFLVGVLVFFHDKITFGNWGIAIILMTICLRILLFPLTFKSIKVTIGMRRLKPEVDALNEKFKDDPQAKNLAMMELWKKNGVNPFGGCLPQLVQMPVWFAMYTTLQTAVEMYHTRFLWFTDLSAPDKFYILPFLLGVFMIIQQRIVPQQGMDPVQQKMMMYMMPAVFTVMMLFLPAALGVYMLTNSILGITQQLVVERIAPSSKGPTSPTKPTSIAKQANGKPGKGSQI
ncbi:MAG: membrane protein insertase YidC [Polyangiaceae bacterium]|nr:membrane protein insertase YidC [Polyangiaceae bacterium]